MARGGSRRTPTGAAAPAADERDRIIDATLLLVASDGWRRLTLAAIAAEADLPILSLYRNFRSKPAILAAFLRRIDEAVLAAPLEAAEDERPRDRIFDLLMRRFDALGPYRDALAVLGREMPADPLGLLGAGARLLCSIAWMLEAAGISTDGLRGIVAIKLTAAAYLTTARTWLHDESPDLAPTMAALDRRLRRIERWYERARPARRGAAAVEA